MASILLIEDDQPSATVIQKVLTADGHEVTVAYDGEAGLCAFDGIPFNLVILDLGLPKISGLVLCRFFRSRERYVPIIMLTGRNAVGDKVVGFEAGADEYLTKPLVHEELRARVRAILRLVERVTATGIKSSGETLRIRDMLLDLEKRTTIKDGVEISLTAREFDLLVFLARHPGKVFSRLQLLREVWGYQHDCYMHTVDSHINRLRGKIEEISSKPNVLLTVWGVGYKLNDSLPNGR